jgi:hypothetical protein
VARVPPDDPEEWGDQEWIDWLQEVDAEAPPLPHTPPSRLRRSATVTVVGSAMIGLHRAIYGEQDADIVMVIEASGDPPDPEKLEVHLDPDDPDASTVTVRPWLDDNDQDDDE